MKVDVSMGASRKEMLLAIKLADITMKDESLYTGDKKVDNNNKVKLALAMVKS